MAKSISLLTARVNQFPNGINAEMIASRKVNEPEARQQYVIKSLIVLEQKQ